MNIRWLWLDYVPKGITLTEEQRFLVRTSVWKNWRQYTVLAIVPVAISTFFLDVPAFTIVLALYGCFVAGGWVFARPTVFRALREAFVNVCPKCGYDLRGQSEERCPECGWDAGDEGAS